MKPFGEHDIGQVHDLEFLDSSIFEDAYSEFKGVVANSKNFEIRACNPQC